MAQDESHHEKIKDLLIVQGGPDKESKVCNFRQVGINQDTLHSMQLQSVGHNTAGVYIAHAISSDPPGPLFYNGKSFILKLYNAEEAAGTLKNLNIKLSDKLVAAYFELKKDGRLQEYIDQMCQQVERSSLPTEIVDAFYQDTIPKSEIAWYLTAKCSTFNRCKKLTKRCIDEGLYHPKQKVQVYRLALAMYCITCARHKEIAVQLFLKQHVTSGILPTMISELKLDTDSDFLGSLVSDAVAMEMFEGITLLDAADSIEAKAVFAQWSNHDLQRGLQDVVHLGSCLLPLGVQQFDCYAQNIFLRFNAESGYITTSWIDTESLKPVQGNAEAKQALEEIIQGLMQQQHASPENHFRLSIDGFGPRMAFVKPYANLEHDLCLALEKFYYGYCTNVDGQHAVRGECRMTYYDINIYRVFQHDLRTTLLYWTFMQSACLAFTKKLHLVTAYLQMLRYMIDFHLEKHGTYCHCWARATAHSIARLHRVLNLQDNSTWDNFARKIVKPLSECTMSIEKLRANAGSSPVADENKGVARDPCELCKQDLLGEDILDDELNSTRQNLQLVLRPATQDPLTADALSDVESNNDGVMEFLSTASINMARAAQLFRPLEELRAETSRARFVALVESGTKNYRALKDWRDKVFPAF